MADPAPGASDYRDLPFEVAGQIQTLRAAFESCTTATEPSGKDGSSKLSRPSVSEAGNFAIVFPSAGSRSSPTAP